MYQIERIRCEKCRGNGVLMGIGCMEHKCPECKGEKEILREKKITESPKVDIFVNPNIVIEECPVESAPDAPIFDPTVPANTQEILPDSEVKHGKTYVDAITGEDIPYEVVQKEEEEEAARVAELLEKKRIRESQKKGKGKKIRG